ncbi:hypothetical protein LIER_32371 [Lithospermum erythrorhizon]|uniref:Uncharacterized protein n=1 Tax=Lithospermum erythrorhizon TaxID=34254 RepID=A0AAV3RTN2_LITER
MENLEVVRAANDIEAPVLVLEPRIEQPREDQLSTELLPSDLSAGLTSIEQSSSVGVVGSTSDSGDAAKVLELEMGRGKRAKVPSVRLHDYVLNTVQKLIWPLFHLLHLIPQWREAMQKEISALQDNGTWTMIQFPEGKNALSTQWIYKI